MAELDIMTALQKSAVANKNYIDANSSDVDKAYVDAGDAEKRAKLQKNKERIDVLEKQAKGILYDFAESSVEGTQTVPKGAHAASVNKLEGKSVVWNQLFQGRNSTSVGNIAIEKVENGYILNGTNETSTSTSISGVNIDFKANHKYYIGGYCGNENKGIVFTESITWSVEQKSRILTPTSDKSSFISLYTASNTVCNNAFISPMVIDLTLMFGAGKEPTLEQCQKIFTENYYPYSAGELQSVDLTKLTVRGRNLLHISEPETINKGYSDYYEHDCKIGKKYSLFWNNSVLGSSVVILTYDKDKKALTNVSTKTQLTNRVEFVLNSEEIKYLRIYVDGSGIFEWIITENTSPIGYLPYTPPIEIPLPFEGKSAGTVHDELDLVNKKYIQRIGVVDLGTFDYTKFTIAQGNLFRTIAPSDSVSRSNNLICQKYGISSYSSRVDKSMYIDTAGLDIVDNSFDDANVFKSAMSGVMLYYELAEPIITDVSTVIDSFEVEPNGSIEFDSSIPFKNTIEYLRYLKEVK